MFEYSPVVRYLPRSLSSDPDLRPALRLGASVAIGYRLRDDALVLTAGTETRTVDLVGLTLLDLLGVLRDAGLNPVWSDPDLVALGAVILADAQGDLAAGDTLELAARTSLIYVFARPVEAEYRRLRAAVPEAAAQVSMASADAAWLDRHGALYGLPRPRGLDDGTYRRWLLAEILRPRNNARGIELTLRRLLGRDIRVLEPWQEVARWSVSAASGAHHLPDGTHWGKNLFQLSGVDPDDLDAARTIVENDRAAGCLMLDPAWTPLARLVARGEIGVRASIGHQCVRNLAGGQGAWPPIWSVSRASDYTVVPTYGLAQSRWTTLGAVLGSTGPRLDRAWRFCRGSATWSEDAPLGDLNTRLAGAWFLDAPGAAVRFGIDAVWSEGEPAQRIDICEWREHAQRLQATADLHARPAGMLREARRAFHALSRIGVGSYRWDDGAWTARRWTFTTAFLSRFP